MSQTAPQVITVTAKDGENDICAKLPCNIGTDYTFKRKIVWFNAIGFLVLHLAALYGFYLGFYCKLATVYWCKYKLKLVKKISIT